MAGGGLSEELKAVIVKEVRESRFRQILSRWTKMEKCLRNMCDIDSNYVSPAKLHGIRSRHRTCSLWCKDDDIEYEIEGEHMKVHDEFVDQYANTLTNLDGSLRLAKCVRLCIPSPPRYVIEFTLHKSS